MNREKIINEINKIFKNNSISKKIETSIYNYSVDYTNTYNMSYLIDNIYNNKSDDILGYLNYNEFLKSAILENKINPEQLAFLKSEELSPDLYESIIKKRELEEYNKNNVKGSSVFTCSKCKKANCSITQKQMRAADEPPTTIVKCLECGYTFKF